MSIDPKRARYDATTRTLRYDATDLGDAAFDTATARELSKLARNGTWDGQAVDAVEVGFRSDACAAKNVDALGFLQLVAVGPSGPAKGAPIRTRGDFGLGDG